MWLLLLPDLDSDRDLVDAAECGLPFKLDRDALRVNRDLPLSSS